MKKIAVLGLGRVGSLAGHLLDDAGFLVTGVDVKEPRPPLPFPVRCLDLHEAGTLDDLLSDCDAVLSCLPEPASGPKRRHQGFARCRRCPQPSGTIYRVRSSEFLALLDSHRFT